MTANDSPELSRAICALALAVVLTSLACGSDAPGLAAAPAVPAAIADQEDAVCGMLVRNQPAPRAQAVHRDGERAFFCSLGDLLVHLGAPSPHGAVQAVFVEVLAAGADPLVPATSAHPWHPADEATYVVGVARKGIMGEPVLAYARPEAARQIAARHERAQVLDYDALQAWWHERENEN